MFFCTATTTTTVEVEDALEPLKHSVLLERLRLGHLKNSAKPETQTSTELIEGKESENGLGKKKKEVENFEELGLSEEVMEALREMGIDVPTEIQSIRIPAVLREDSGLGFSYWLWQDSGLHVTSCSD